MGAVSSLLQPGHVGLPFTDKCIKAAGVTSTGLVNTVDLFRVVQHLSYSKDEDFACACRKALLNGTGPVILPQTPDRPVGQREDRLDVVC